jgi:GT2 family glycosyltransferase
VSAAPLRVAVMITTHNRRAELERTCAVLERLEPAPDEILVFADACTDGTNELLAGKGAPYRVWKSAARRGSIPNRDEMLRAATAEIVLSLDDDSHPLETDAIARIRALFEASPGLAVASFPQRTDEFPETLSAESFGPRLRIGSYASSSVALRRADYLELGGYETLFGHSYEEPDYALRCLAAGRGVQFEPALTVRHYFTGAQRNEIRNHHLHARNEHWSVLMRCPFPWWPLVAGYRAVRQLGYAWKRGGRWVLREPLWWWAALRGVPRALARRAPVAWPQYLAWMRLLGKPAVLP